MKKITLLYFLPAIAALLLLICFMDRINAFCFPEKQSAVQEYGVRYVAHFKEYPGFEEHFLTSNDSSETIYLLGSSELSGATEATPYHFISDHFHTKMVGIGHAGNQCFSIYSQLLAAGPRLKGAPVVIILSPIWFQSNEAWGTTSPIFLEFNTPYFLNRVIRHSPRDRFRTYETDRIADFYTEIVNPDLSMKLLYFEHQSSKSFLHKWIYAPLIAADKALNNYRSRILDDKTGSLHQKRKPLVKESVTIPWDSLFAASKQEQLSHATNNPWGIDDDYYTEYVQGGTGELTSVPTSDNQELKDFHMLLDLLKARGAKASFIVLPMHANYYTNARVLDPVIHTITTAVSKYGYPVLNLWNSDPMTFEKGILKDVMHLSSYGWYKADRFIVETYQLNK